MAEDKTETAKSKEIKRKDELLYCENCGISFLWSIEEQKKETQSEAPQYCKGCQQLLAAPRRERGLVKWFNTRKHFGFIVRRDAEEIFAPAAEVKGRRRLKEGDLVEFQVGINERGVVAQDIRIL